MPLLDHFKPPVLLDLPWDTLHSSWGTRIADALNDRWLPKQFVALEHTHVGPKVEIDVVTIDRGSATPASGGNGAGGVATLSQVWAPPQTLVAIPAVFPDRFEIKIVATEYGRPVVAAIELISPSNKSSPGDRNAFVSKCASYLHDGISLVIIDVVTERRANLHNELVRWLQAPHEALLPPSQHLYAAAYRPVLRDDKPQIDVWAEPCAIGEPLPTMPLRLTGDLFVPVEFESTYQECCRRRRLP